MCLRSQVDPRVGARASGQEVGSVLLLFSYFYAFHAVWCLALAAVMVFAEGIPQAGWSGTPPQIQLRERDMWKSACPQLSCPVGRVTACVSSGPGGWGEGAGFQRSAVQRQFTGKAWI